MHVDEMRPLRARVPRAQHPPVFSSFILRTLSYQHSRRYEGGGIFRDVSLLRSSLPARLADDGIFSPSFVTGAYTARATPAEGMSAASVTFAPVITVEGVGAPASPAELFSVGVSLYAADGVTLLAASARAAGNATPGASTTLSLDSLSVANVELWTIARPYLHVLVATLFDSGGAPLDAANISVGVRDVRWDADEGAFINEQHVKLRGFCNHASWTAVGMGVPPRINLLRLQQIRGMGGNSWVSNFHCIGLASGCEAHRPA